MICECLVKESNCWKPRNSNTNDKCVLVNHEILDDKPGILDSTVIYMTTCFLTTGQIDNKDYQKLLMHLPIVEMRSG